MQHGRRGDGWFSELRAADPVISVITHEDDDLLSIPVYRLHDTDLETSLLVVLLVDALRQRQQGGGFEKVREWAQVR